VLRNVLRALFAGPRKPSFADFATAFRLYQEGNLDAAERACGEVAGAPAADVAYLRGLIAQKRGDHASAVIHFKLAITERNTESTFHFTLGESLIALKRFDAALEHLARFLELVAADDPRRAGACLMCAACRSALEDPSGADEWYRRALALAPDDPSVLSKAIRFLYLESRIEEARALADRRQGAAPDDPVHRIERALLLPAIYDSRDEIAATRARLSRDLDALLERPAARVEAPEQAILPTAFYLAYHGENNVDLLKKLCAVCRRVYPAATQLPGPLRLARRTGRLRVGFVSASFYAHSVARVTIGLIRDLPRDRFSVTVFSITPTEDDFHRRIVAAADRHVILSRNIEEARRVIAEAGLDALIFTDLGTTPVTYFLALWRLAPVQAVTWGHPETSGIDTVDYFFSADAVEIESAQRHYTETLVRSKAFFMPAFDRPVLDRALGRRELGLPENRALYACLQAPYKFHPDFDAVLAGILDGDPTGEILLLDLRRSWTDQLRARLARSLGSRLERVRFLPRMRQERYLATVAAADVSLDPLHFVGGNSSIEAMALGVPIVTLPATHLRGRLTFGLYAEMGFFDCIASSAGQYVDIAVRLGRDRELRAWASRELVERSTMLFDRKDAALALGDFLEGAARSRS
jgi:CRISPR-associated protein Csy1